MKKFLLGCFISYLLTYSIGATYIIYKGGRNNV